MIPGGFTNERILQAVDDQFAKFQLANYSQVFREQPVYKVTYLNEQIFTVLMEHQAKTKVS